MTMSVARGWAALLVLGSAVTIAACGGSSSSITRGATPASGTSPTTSGSASSAFVSQANAACAASYTTYGGVKETIGESYPLTGPTAGAGLAAGDAKAVQTEIGQLSSLSPPPGSEAKFADLMSQLRARVAADRQLQAAATNQNRAADNAARARLDAAIAQGEADAAQIGLSACAGKGLSPQELAQAERAATLTATRNDPAYCAQLYTPAAVKAQFGSVSKCLVAQRTGAGTATARSLTFAGSDGAGDYVILHAIAHGGSLDGKRFSVFMYKQSGQWRVQDIELA